MRWFLGAVFALFAVGATQAAPAWDDAAWVLQRERDGIRIWTMREEGKAIDSYKAELTLAAPLEEVLERLIDIEDFARWAPDIREAYALDAPQSSYIAYAMPFPVRDRDMAQRYELAEGFDGSVTVRIVPEPESAPVNDRRVRVRDAELVWRLVPLAEGAQTQLRSIGYTDPEGGVPPFIINMLLVEGPLRTLRALRAEVEAEGGAL